MIFKSYYNIHTVYKYGIRSITASLFSDSPPAFSLYDRGRGGRKLRGQSKQFRFYLISFHRNNYRKLSLSPFRHFDCRHCLIVLSCVYFISYCTRHNFPFFSLFLELYSYSKKRQSCSHIKKSFDKIQLNAPSPYK